MDGLGIYLLLLLAIACGWLLGRVRRSSRRKRRRSHDVFSDYFVGLNYLLNDEPDEAIDTFINSLEATGDTPETHLALGALLRRRGKVDKAIKVHQALLARPDVSREFSDSTRLQLATDYISAGLLDRAERLLNDLLNEDTPAKWDALRHLITIYQTEKEWENAIACSTRLLTNSVFKRDAELRTAAAHYCCELAELRIAQNQYQAAKDQARRAFTFDRKHRRASMILVKVEHHFGNYAAALKELARIQSSSPEFTSQLLPQFEACYRHLGRMADYELLLHKFSQQVADVKLVLALAELKQSLYGNAAAAEFLAEKLREQPNLAAIVELLRLQAVDATITPDSATIELLQQVVHKMQQRKAAFRCHHCGYESRNLYWLCPSCKVWDKSKPITESDKT